MNMQKMVLRIVETEMEDGDSLSFNPLGFKSLVLGSCSALARFAFSSCSISLKSSSFKLPSFVFFVKNVSFSLALVSYEKTDKIRKIIEISVRFFQNLEKNLVFFNPPHVLT